MEILSLEEISEAVGSVTPVTGKVDRICTDTRKITENSVFIALKGANYDGHSFVKPAIEGGALAAITEFQIGNCPCIKVKDTRKALLDIAKFYRKKFSPILVGVTGSVGKTTTKEMIYLVLSSKYKTLKNEGNFNNEIGVPLTLFNLDSSYEAAVIEMGMSHFGEIHRLSRVSKPTVSVITNIGFSHIENLGSQEGICKAKLEILDGMEQEAPLILNADDKILSKICLDREIITYGVDNELADVRAINIESTLDTKFDIAYKKEFYHAKLGCIGKHNILNALAAFSVGITCNIEPELIISALEKYEPVGMRQRVEKKNGQTVIIDCYNASPDSMRAALSVLSQLVPENGGNRVAVLADMLELGEMSPALHESVGEMAVNAGIDKLICYGDNAKFIAKRADEMGLHSGFTSDKGMLLEYLGMTVKPGDIVLFKGSRGMKLEEIIGEFYK